MGSTSPIMGQRVRGDDPIQPHDVQVDEAISRIVLKNAPQASPKRKRGIQGLGVGMEDDLISRADRELLASGDTGPVTERLKENIMVYQLTRGLRLLNKDVPPTSHQVLASGALSTA